MYEIRVEGNFEYIPGSSVGEARASLGRYLNFYNSLRPHSSLGRKTPDEAYFNPVAIAMAV